MDDFQVDKYEASIANIENTQKVCQMLLKQKHYAKMGEDGIFAIVTRAKSLNIDPIDALNGALYYVNGKVGMSTEQMATLVRQAGHSVVKDEKSTPTCCILRCKRKDNGDTWTVSFSIDDAKRAGIYNDKGTWGKYPSTMAYNRAMALLCRQLFPDVIKGAGYTMDELQEIKEGKVREVVQEPEILLSEAQVEEIKALVGDDWEFEKELLTRLKNAFGCDGWDQVPAKQYKGVIHVIQKHNEERLKQELNAEATDVAE